MTTWVLQDEELHYTNSTQWMRWTGSGWSSTNGAPFEPAGTQENDLCIVVIYGKNTTPLTVISGWNDRANYTDQTALTGSTPTQVVADAVRGASPLNMSWPPTWPAGTRIKLLWYRADAGASTPVFGAAATQNHTELVTDIVLPGGLTTAVADELLVVTAAQGVGAQPTNAIATDPGTGSGSSEDLATPPSTTAWLNRELEVSGNIAYLVADAVKATPGSTGDIHVTGGQTRTSIITAMRYSASAPADVTPPVLSSPTSAATGATTGSGTVTTDEGNGTLFAVVTTSATTPSATQVRAGQDHTGAAAAFAVGSGSGQAVSATGVQNVAATGLVDGTTYYWHFLHDDAAANASNLVSSAGFTPTSADVIAPTFSAAPAVSGLTQTGGTFTATIDETGDIFYVIVPQADANPTPAEVIAGQASGGGAPLDAGSALAGTSISDAFSGLAASTAYKAVCVAQDDEGAPNVQSSVTAVNFTTAAPPDTTPPTFSVAPAVSSITQTGGTATATINETGDIFYVVVPQGDTTPSVGEVIAGQASGGGAPLDAGSVLAGTSISDAFSGLTAGTAYKAVFVARDDEGAPNVQASVTPVNFTTASASGTITLPAPVNGANDALAAQSIKVKIASISTGVDVHVATVSYTSGNIVVTDASIATGTTYAVFCIDASGQTAKAVLTAT